MEARTEGTDSGADTAGTGGCAFPADQRRGLLLENLMVYGVGGPITLFIGFKVVDLVLGGVL